MSWNDRVVWSEGQFLLPQMFQQQERYLEHVMHYRSLPLTPFSGDSATTILMEKR